MSSTHTIHPAPSGGRSISRRSFLVGLGAVAAAAALLAIEAQLPASASQPAASAATLGRSLFTGALGTRFQIHIDPSHLPVELIDVRDLHAASYQRPAVDREQNFSLLFHSPLSTPLDQDTYRFAHSRIGSFPLFIVPVQYSQRGTYYEAIFSRQSA